MSKVILASTIVLAGCGIGLRDEGPRELRTMHKDVAKTKASEVQVELTMGAGEMELRGGSAKLMEGDFTFDVPSWQPEVRYEDSSFRGRLFVRQTEGGSGFHGNTKNEWKLRLADDVPMSLTVHLGAGESNLVIGTLTLRDVEVHIGAGRTEIDLRGEPKRSFAVQVRGGVGEAVIRVSHSAAVHAEASGGLGEIKVTGMDQDGKAWATPSYGKAKNSISLDVRGGIGSIRIDAE